jgi:hypothetical protein
VRGMPLFGFRRTHRPASPTAAALRHDRRLMPAAVAFVATGQHFRRVQNAHSARISRPTASKIERFRDEFPGGKPVKPTVSTGVYGAGDGNRTHVRSLGSFYTAIVRRPLDAVILTHSRGSGTDPAIQVYLLYALSVRRTPAWINRKKSRSSAGLAREYPAAKIRVSGLPSAAVPVAACGSAACTSLIPSGTPARRIRVRADPYFAVRGIADCTATLASFLDATCLVG